MYEISSFEIILKLVLSAILGGLIGFEREIGNRPAGLRTHILVSVGAALIMLVSKYGFEGSNDPARLAAQVVSGIGFLGAGTILRTGNTIQGLTTAASLWVCAGIGLAIGNGFYFGAVVSTIIVLISLVILVRIENMKFLEKRKHFQIVAQERPGLIGDIGTFFGHNNLTIKRIDIKTLDDKEEDIRIEIDFIVASQSNKEWHKIIDLLSNIKGIENIKLE